MSDNTSDQSLNYMYDDDWYKDDDGSFTISKRNLYILFLDILVVFLLIMLIIYICKKNRIHAETKIRANKTACAMIMDPNTVYVPEMCTICLSIYTDDEMITTLTCGHSFHEACISEWYTTSTLENETGGANCPYCNEVFIIS